jgi:small subunit ribosomal protein S20
LANHKSAIKRNQQNTARKLRNQMGRSRIKSLTKEVLTSVEAGNKEEALQAFRKAAPVIQKAASKGTIHRNTASRKISRLSRKVNATAAAE